MQAPNNLRTNTRRNPVVCGGSWRKRFTGRTVHLGKVVDVCKWVCSFVDTLLCVMQCVYQRIHGYIVVLCICKVMCIASRCRCFVHDDGLLRAPADHIWQTGEVKRWQTVSSIEIGTEFGNEDEG